MKKRKNIIKRKISNVFKFTSLVSSILAVCLLFGGSFLSIKIPESYLCYNGEIYFTTNYPISIKMNDSSSKTNNAQAMLLDSIPIKSVTVNVTNTKKVFPCGTPLGIKMYCVGAVVVDTQEIKNGTESICPAKKAGIKKGDIIKTVDNTPISNNSDLINAVNSSGGKEITITFLRDENEHTVKVTPIDTNNSGDYKIGVWVRDSSAGIGTVTFYDPESGNFAALGHGICDIDTGKLLPMSSGIPVNASIDSVQKSMRGSVGCLLGHFTNDIESGSVYKNTECGLYGYMKGSPINNEPIEIASQDEIKCGKAQILSTVSGTTPKYYDIEIEALNTNSDNHTKNFIIKVTDKELLEITGGIVQGMSGSPIIQNGKLVGAITHVFVNSPEKGYGIYASNMLKVMEEINLKKAS